MTAQPTSPGTDLDKTPREATIHRLPKRAAGGEVILDSEDPGDHATAYVGEGYDTSFDLALDDDPGPMESVQVDQADRRDPMKRPIIPLHLQTAAGVKNTAQRAASVTGYRLSYHVLRLPMYAAMSLVWAVAGLGRLIGRQVRWWWHPELSELLQVAAKAKDMKEGREIDKRLSRTRRARGIWLATEFVGLLIAVPVVYFQDLWIQLIVAATVVPFLVRAGLPKDRRLISAAVVVPRHRRLNADIVLRAYYAAGLGHPDKPDMQVTFGSQMSRDAMGAGSQVVVDVPHGIAFTEVMNRREKLASGLDVALSQVYLTPDKTSNRRHLLWVADIDPLGISAGRTPLLDCKPRDVWTAAPLGLDERGKRVLLPLIWHSMLIGAQPRKGKTFTARALGLWAALDPYVRLSVFDGKGSPDWRKFALVAHTFGFGILPDKVQGDPIENLLSTLRAVKHDVMVRNAKLSELPTSICPEGKLTREIARNPRYGMPVWVIILDEFQEYLMTGDDDQDREIAELLGFLVKVGPSSGIILISSTQRPSSVGSTQKVKQLFTAYRDNHLTRFALKTGSYTVSDLVLGAGAYQEGYDSSKLPVGDGMNGSFDYRGIGILYDSPVGSGTVRTYLADGQDAEKILLAARRLRERVGTLDGMAAGESVAVQARDVLADALDSFLPTEAALDWHTLADRLQEALPDRYADVTGDAISATLRQLGLGIESKNVRIGTQVLKGVQKAQLERAMAKRESDGNR